MGGDWKVWGWMWEVGWVSGVCGSVNGLHSIKPIKWASSWPMSEQVVVDMVLAVDRHGDVDLGAWKSAVGSGNAMAVHWWNGVVLGNDRWNSEGFHVCPLLSMV